MAGVTTSRTNGQCHSSSLLRLIVCMLALQQDECFFFPKSGTIIPNGGKVCTGQNLNLTFTPFDPQVLENVRLQMDGTLVSSAPTQIVNTTAIFTVSIMSDKEFLANDDYLHIYCFTSLDCTVLIIYIVPEPVKNFTCVAYDDTDTTVCTWELGKEYNWRVKPNLLWRTSGSQEQWKLCPDLRLTSCTWLGTRLPKLELRVDVSCECGVNASSLHTLDTKAIRMPEPAIFVNATSLNSTCILVTWSVKQTSYAKTHHLFVGSKLNDSQLHRYNDTDMKSSFPKSREKIICGLNPDTVYECSVALLPQNGGYFSRNVTTSALTHYTVPGSSPSVVPDGFEWNPASCVSSRYRFVTVYWQPIPKLDQNGEMKAYVLTIEGDRVSRDVQEVASDVTSLRLYLMCDTYYTVHIQARNNAGTSRQRSRIVIPQATAVPSTAPDGLAVQPGPEDNSLYVTWDKIPYRPEEPHISSYIVQYCLQKSNGACLDQHKVTVAGGFTAVTLLWLQSDVTYNVRVQGVSNMGAPGPFSRPVVGIPLIKRLPVAKVAIIVGGVILLACLIPGCKCIRGRCKRLCHVEEVPIKDLLPEDVNVTPTNKP